MIARTFEYEIRPARKASCTRGKRCRRNATRTCSRAVDAPIDTAYDSHSAGVRAP